MHFFYLDETGCTGADLGNPEQPIFVLGGLSVKAQGWRETTEQLMRAAAEFFSGQVPPGYELHATELLNGQGAFSGYSRNARNAFTYKLLEIITERKHAIHFIAIDKTKLAGALPGTGHDVVKCHVPYLLGFNYLVSYIERYTKEILGSTVRAMIILDQKDMYQADIDTITNYRRYKVAKARRLKWLVEFSYPIDSVRHPMIQISDLIIFLVRKFLEMENGYRPGWREEARSFYAACYARIDARVHWSSLIEVAGKEEADAHRLLKAARSTHRVRWKSSYSL